MPTSAPGSSRGPARRLRAPKARGFTLIEIFVVLLIVALGAGAVSLALRDGGERRLAREGERLASLLESARAEARAGAFTVRWVPAREPGADDFLFVGLPKAAGMPTHWLEPGVSAQVLGASAVALGPEPLIGAQRIVLRLGEQRLELATDGLAPFSVVAPS